jgi:hypothetical protein
MLKGRFLGIPQNVGDAFCFLILTQPEHDDEAQPQVLACSVIRKRYPREEPPRVRTPSTTSAPLLFYRSDGVTPLDDPAQTSGSDKDDIYSDVVAEDSLYPTLLAQSILPPSSGDIDDSDPFDDGILEVYGPLTSQPHHTNVASKPGSSDSPASLLQLMLPDSEEQPVLTSNNQTRTHPSLMHPSSLPL